MAKSKDIPVYLFTGFLEAGKTKFIQETLEDRRFNNGERTLLLLCEQGEEEYAPEQFHKDKIYIREIDSEADLTPEKLARYLAECNGERVVVEYNGMWMLDSLYAAMPEGWVVYQEFMFSDANTFLSYNANMRQLTYDKLKSCELVVFNRYTPDVDKTELHKIVRGATRRADIAYESPDGSVEYDDIEDPLPFDISAPVIEIGDDDYAVWYRDLSETPENYDGKTVRVKVRALTRRKLPAKTFIVGRHVMACCEQDTQFAALVCQWDEADSVENDKWLHLTARIDFKFNKAYGKKGPVLTYVEATPCEVPAQAVATFY